MIQLRSLLWVVAACVYTAHSLPLEKRTQTTVCRAFYKDKPVDFHGEKAVAAGDIYKVTAAAGIPTGEYLIKTNLKAHELDLTQKMGLVFAHNKETDHTKQCIIMRKVGLPITHLASYKKLKTEKECKVWLEEKLKILDLAVRNMRSYVHDGKSEDWAHGDLHPGNTRWTSETAMVLIDYGSAQNPYYVVDQHSGRKVDLDDLALWRKTWIGELCAVDIGKEKPDVPTVVINPTRPLKV
ncbi:hypothetical protein FRC17_003642 [Serendipita sp. 399]|nr:hypothetical protein FRC17_003642 [Serendipita sp. 399]